MSKITSIRKVANDSLQAEIVDFVERTGSVNVLAKLNKGDARFKSGSERRAWFPVTLASLLELGLSTEAINKISALTYGEKFEVNLENPTIDGHLLRVQITESISPDIYQRQNTAKTAKQIEIDERVANNKKLNTPYDLTQFVGQVGYFLDAEGSYIFSRSSVAIDGQVNHTFVDGVLVPESMMGEYGANLAEATPVEEEVEA